MANQVSITSIMNDMETLEKRINKLIEQGPRFISFTVGSSSIVGYKTVADYEVAVKDRYKQVFDLIRRRNYLLQMRTLVNAGVTDFSNVTRRAILRDENYQEIGKLTMAEVLMREQSIGFEETILTKMKNDLRTVTNEVQKAEASEKSVLEQRIAKYMEGDKVAEGKEGMVAGITAEVKQEYGVTWVDPLGLSKMIEVLDLHVTVFKSKIKTIKAEHNSEVKIDIPDDLNEAGKDMYLTALPVPTF